MNCPLCGQMTPHNHKNWKAFLRALPTSDREAMLREASTSKGGAPGRIADVVTDEHGNPVIVRRRES